MPTVSSYRIFTTDGLLNVKHDEEVTALRFRLPPLQKLTLLPVMNIVSSREDVRVGVTELTVILPDRDTTLCVPKFSVLAAVNA